MPMSHSGRLHRFRKAESSRTPREFESHHWLNNECPRSIRDNTMVF